MVAAPEKQAGKAETAPVDTRPPKPTNKAERRALQEAQRAAKASQAVSSPSAPRSAPNEPSPSVPSAANKGKGKEKEKEKEETSHIAHSLFTHLDPASRTTKTKSGSAEVHPAILSLALQWAAMEIVGANARCISMLTAFQQVIGSYTLPQGQVLSRHLPHHLLSPQIEHLYKARARSLTLGNAIRYLKLEIAQIPIDMDEEDAKAYLHERIDHFIRDRIIVADKVIQSHAIAKIHDGDTILTFARSSVVESTLIEARRQGKQFQVIVVDSRPLNEGKNLLNSLHSHDIPCTYALISSLGALLSRFSISLVMLGTHALLSDGAMFSRAGTATVAMMCRQAGIPVACLCETYKFSERVMLDSIAGNEMASVAKTGSETANPHLAVFDLLYDVARPEDVTVVISDAGLIPVKSVPAILRDYKPLSNPQAQA